jgi:biopolymer transport protein TolQ
LKNHYWRIVMRCILTALTCFALINQSLPLIADEKAPQATNLSPAEKAAAASQVVEEQGSSTPLIVSRAMSGGFVVVLVLLILVSTSIFTWAIVLNKWRFLRKYDRLSSEFVKTFWDSRSLNDLNSRLGDYPDSPAKEMFRSGYAELVRGNQLRDQSPSLDIAVQAVMENLSRTLSKAKITERTRIEKHLPILAVAASAAPFIGLFGTVWGIMNAFEGIAQSGNASLSAVAPGISEALIATAFGLAAAIPAAIAYNLFTARIRGMLMKLDGFTADFLNIVERYLVAGKQKSANPTTPSQTTL